MTLILVAISIISVGFIAGAAILPGSANLAKSWHNR